MVSNLKQSVCCDFTPITISLKSHYISQWNCLPEKIQSIRKKGYAVIFE